MGTAGLASRWMSMSKQWDALQAQWRKTNALRQEAQETLAAAIQGVPALRRASALAQQGAIQLDTVARGAANVMTLGGADYLAAGANAVFQAANGANLGERYQTNLRDERARNRQDHAQRPLARGVGNAGGAVMGVAATAAAAPVVGVAAAVPRLAGAARLTGRETAAIVAGGGLAGLGVQMGSDTLQGQTSTAGDSIGAAIGGAVGVAALPAGPVRAGALGAAATTTAQDLFNGRTPSVETAAQAAMLGGLLGGAADGAAQHWSNGLSTEGKGNLGDFIGSARSKLNGEPRPMVGYWPRDGEKLIEPDDWVPITKRRDYLNKEKTIYWYPDGVSGNFIRFEDKFGFDVRLSPNQIIAQKLLGDKFVLYHTGPPDVGKAASAILSPFATPVLDQDKHYP